MSEVLIGVVLGGLIASIAPFLSLYFSEKRWRKETKINHLRQKRDKLETLFEKTLDKLSTAISENSYPSDMMSDFDFIFPKEVSEKFEEMMGDKEKDDLRKKFHFYDISKAMKKSLADIDKEINNEIGS